MNVREKVVDAVLEKKGEGGVCWGQRGQWLWDFVSPDEEFRFHSKCDE
jgi:hypothetical protein